MTVVAWAKWPMKDKFFVGARAFLAPINHQDPQPGDLLEWKPQLELQRVDNNTEKSH